MKNIPTAPGKRAVIYLRTGRSWQRERCQAVARKHGCTVVREYVDYGPSNFTHHPPTLRKLLDDLSRLQIDYVIVADLQCISRNVRLLLAVECQICAAGAQLVVYGEGEVHIQFRLRLMATLAEFEAAHTSWQERFDA